VSDSTPSTSPPARESLFARLRLPVGIYLACLAAYLGTAAGRLKKHSDDNHYVYLADCFRKGRLSLAGAPPHENDWALVHELTLRDGRKLRGSFLQTGGTGWFKTTRGERLVVTPDQIASRTYSRYVSFPWFPAVLMLPFVAAFGLSFNDVIFTAAVAAFNPMLVFLILRRLRRIGLSARTTGDDLWLTLTFAFGTVHYFSSVMGQVWYTAHVVGVAIAALYVLACLEGRHPFWAGLLLGLGFVTRGPTLPLTFPLLVGEVLRRHLRPLPEGAHPPSGGPGGFTPPGGTAVKAVPDTGPDATRRPELWPWLRSLAVRVRWGGALRDLVIAGIPACAIAGVAFLLNYLRFDNPFEFGHYYLNVVWQERIQRFGLMNYHYVSRNLAVMLTLLPRIMTSRPYVKISWHGLGLFFTTPLFLYTLWPRRRSPLAPWLYLSCLLPLIPMLLYQNSGWVQFGYRFSLDFTVFLIMLIALGGHRLGLVAKALILFSIGVNTFGAITFNRYMNFYEDFMFPMQ
jgi:hypothetical protein